MKKLILLFIATIVVSVVGYAQTRIIKTTYKLTSNTIVKDSTGKLIPYDTWHPLMVSGDYRLRADKPGVDSTAFTLVKKTYYEKQKSLELMPPPPESKFFNTGGKLDLFTANAIDGYKIRPKELTGKIVVLNFWFMDCPPCRMEMPELNKIALKYADNPDVVFISVGLDYSHDIKKFTKDHPLAYHLVEYGRRIAEGYGINLYPTNVVLDKEGKVRFHSSGFTLNTPYWITKTIEESK